MEATGRHFRACETERTPNFHDIAYRHGSTFEHSDSWSSLSYLERHEAGIHIHTEPSGALIGEVLLLAAFGFAEIITRWGRFYGMDLGGAEAQMIVEDICITLKNIRGLDLWAAYIRASKPCIVKFHSGPVRDCEIESALIYIFAKIHNLPEYLVRANCSFDGGGQPVPAHRIIEVEYPTVPPESTASSRPSTPGQNELP